MLDPREIPRARKRLAFDYLLRHVLRPRVKQLPDARQRDGDYTVAEAVLSALAMFSLKTPRCWPFKTAGTIENMKNLLPHRERPQRHPNCAASSIRWNPIYSRPRFKTSFRELQRGTVLEPFVFYQGQLLVVSGRHGILLVREGPIARAVSQRNNTKNGQVTYYHQLLGVTLVYLDSSRSSSRFAPRRSSNRTARLKNDCERNASKRLLGEDPPANIPQAEPDDRGRRLGQQWAAHSLAEAVDVPLYPRRQTGRSSSICFPKSQRASREGRLTIRCCWTEPGKGPSSRRPVRAPLR